MRKTTEVIFADTQVMFVAGHPTKPIPEQAQYAFTALEARLASLKGRRFFGVLVGDEYRACSSITEEDKLTELPHMTWTIPGGKYARTKIPDWEAHTEQIGPAFEELCSRLNVDLTRPGIEYYRSQKELFLMVPVK